MTDQGKRACALQGAGQINERFARGLTALQAIGADQAKQILSSVSDIAPDFAAYLVEFAFGDIGARPGLDLKQREFAAVAALAAMRGADPQLRAHLRGALELGWTVDELVELLMQISVYAGFPAAIAALTSLKAVIQEPTAPTEPRS